MAEVSRLAALPGYDTAPDVYETNPDPPTDSTTHPSSAFSAAAGPTTDVSATSEDDDEDLDSELDDDDDEAGKVVSRVLRRRLYPSTARSRFAKAERRVVGQEKVDLSDRVDGRRRGLKVRRRRREGMEEDGDEEEEEEEEGLEMRIARLRMEVEECLAEVEEQGGKEAGEGAEETVGQVEALGRALAGLEARRSERRGSRRQRGEGEDAIPRQGEEEGEEGDGASDEQVLERVAEFDTRLSALEQALGISNLDAVTERTVSMPVLPSLALLDRQLTALTSASSLSSLEEARSKIRELKMEADAHSRGREATSDSTTGEGAEDETPPFSPEDLAKLQQLYTLLPNLQSLAPIVPAMLARLRSLRSLHTSAANAANELDELEKRQAEMDSELAAWRQGLEKVEAAVSRAGEANGVNGKMVEGWVRELEGRLRSLR